MPQVPTYDGPRLRTEALRPVFGNAPDVSSGLQSLGRAVGQVTDELDRKIQRDAEIAANKADSEITAGWLEWDAANRPKYRGQNVDQYEAAAREWWDKAADNYGKTLDPMAKSRVGQSLQRKRVQAIGSVLGYVGQEKERFADETAAASVATSIQFGVTTGDVAGAAEQVRKLAADVGARKGWTTEQVQAEQQKNLSALHLAYITKLASTDAAKAREYYDANKAEVGFAQQARVEEVLKGELDNQEATRFAASVAGRPFSEQLSEAAKIQDPQRREKTLQRIRENETMARAARQEREQAASDQAWQLVGQGKRVPEVLLAQMDGRERVQLRDYLTQKAKQASEGTVVKTDWATYIDAREKLAAGEKVNLVALTTKIAPAQMEQLLDIQTKARTPSKAPEVASSEQQLSAFTTSLDLKGDNVGKFKAAAYDMFNEHLKRTGKEPTFDERDKIMRDLNREIVTKPGWLWDTKDPAFKADPETRRRALAPAAAPAAALPRVSTTADWERLPKGQRYIDPQGQERVKQ